MHIDWFSGLSPDEAKSFKQQIFANRAIIERINSIIEAKLQSAESELFNKEIDPHMMYNYIGRIKVLRDLRNYTNIKDTD